MGKKLISLLKLLVTIAIVCLFVWYLVISPMITFNEYEETFKAAAERYYELNQNQLPTGERVKTLSLNALYKDSYLKEDFYIPYTKKPCSLEKSWVKVRRNNGVYEYIVYLDCGTMKSNVDHEGPVIKLKGENTVDVTIGEEYKDEGVESVRDAVDGKINVDTVTVRSNVDTKKIGSYEVKYTAYDSLNNKTVVTREVNVVKSVKSVVKKDLGEATNYKGEPLNNYVRLSGMYFRIYGLTDDGKNVILVSDEDIANVGFNKLEKWLDDYFYDHLNEFTKKNIVESKFCNMTVDDGLLNITECTEFTGKRKIHVPSIVEVNKAYGGVNSENGEILNFLRTDTISWLANKKDDQEAYVTRKRFYDPANNHKVAITYDQTFNYGVKPMFVLNGDALIINGDGTLEAPYEFGDHKKVKFGEKLSDRETGEYVFISGTLYRIIDITKDDTTRVISMNSFGIKKHDDLEVYSDPETEGIVYDPTARKSVGYFINNGAMEYIETKYFVNHEIEVPTYKGRIVYGDEIETKKYKVKLSAPNMFEMFSAMGRNYGHLYDFYSYWMVNGSKDQRFAGVVTDIGVPVNEEIGPYWRYGIRVVGQIKKSAVVVSGKGTYFSPYKIS